jgi:hypothetical protein
VGGELGEERDVVRLGVLDGGLREGRCGGQGGSGGGGDAVDDGCFSVGALALEELVHGVEACV